ncbi:phosphotransferase [Paenibacillus allorhizosphaerae]|uniref:Homoserine kinase n=1 Tax=Paenibacillus allorhizosphaerae TaxID=2849866 RepID=A0ABN7TNY7_9BACL|nr:phosphotransferase [Paenibacillus allorhizosphaerae]CAG7649239.1 Homoserine kinase [Paenibacillus allorhizosphaerae]
MENAISADFIQDEIIDDLRMKFQWKVGSVRRNEKGYGNVSWIMNTDQGPRFVKKYCKIRYRRGLDSVCEALKYQEHMHRDGIACQPVYAFEGETIHTTASGEQYMISGVSEGHHIAAGEATAEQMFSLGEATGRMHQWMKSNIPPRDSLHWELPSKESLLKRLDKNRGETLAAGHETYAQAIEKQRNILNRLDLDDLKSATHGWAHWDMHVDNLLFHKDRLADILDFDRVQYVYPDFDISRALLSCSLASKSMRMETVEAYVNGYRGYCRLSEEQLVRSIRLTWYKECKWVHAIYAANKPMSRFIEEMIWIADHWDNLEERFGGIS